MESIIEFIFGNLFFVILVLGALYNLFMRNKAQEEAKKEQEKKRRAGAPNQAPAQEIDWKEIFRQEKAPVENPNPRPVLTVPQPEVMVNSRPQTELEKHRELLQKKKDELKIRREVIEKDSPIFNDEIKDKVGGSSYFHNITKEEVVKGVVWSEVLGKPRSKKPLERFFSK